MSERAPGVWRLRVFIGSDPETGRPRQATRTLKGSRRQAETALAEFVAEASGDALAFDGGMVLSAFFTEWLAHLGPTRSPTTLRGYRTKIKRINAKLGNRRLSALTPPIIDRAYREWMQEGLNPNTVHHFHAVLSAALNQAVKWGLLRSAPTSRTSPPPLRAATKQIPTVDDIRRLVVAAEQRDQPVLAAAIAVAATTGMRRGELLGLRWGDVDFAKGLVHVRRTIKHADGTGWVVGPPKTHQERLLSLDDFTAAILTQHRAKAAEWAHAFGAELGPEAYVLTLDPSGAQPFPPDSLGQAFRRLCEREGIKGLTLHSLRHFSASMLISSGRDVRTIAGRLGHADASTTLRVYAHMVEGRDRDAADFIGGLFATQEPAALEPGDPSQPQAS